MQSKVILFTVACLCLTLISKAVNASPTEFATQPNSIAVIVDRTGGSVNVPWVSVTICEPSSKSCQTIDHIMVDTGSVGLRILSTALKIPLNHKVYAEGAPLMECHILAGDNSWGSLNYVDAQFGKLKAKKIILQVIGSVASAPVGSRCSDPQMDFAVKAGEGVKGILGIAPAKNDCLETSKECTSAKYFLQKEDGLVPIQPTLESDWLIGNPLLNLGRDANGFVFEMPAIPEEGVSRVKGRILFGINTRKNNQIPNSAIKINSNQAGWFWTVYKDKKYISLFDSGTYSYEIPSALGIKSCTVNPDQLCPDSDLTLNSSILDFKGDAAGSLDFKVRSANELSEMFKKGHRAFSSLGTNSDSYFTYGFPFFYGKRIFFVIENNEAVIGAQNYVAVAPLDD